LPDFLLPFGHRHSLPRSSDPRWEMGLPCGRLTGHVTVDGSHRGSHVAHARDATGVGASCISGAAVLVRPTKNPRPAPAASQRQAPVPRLIPSARLTHNETSTEVHAIHPSGLPLARDPLDGAGVLRLSLRASHPAVASDARRGWGQALEHRPETTHPALGRPSILRVRSLHATSCRNFFFVSTLRIGKPAAVKMARCTAM
jgi:hypothetical protein